MQTNFLQDPSCKLYFILLSENISFINKNILTASYRLSLPHLPNIQQKKQINYDKFYDTIFACITAHHIDFSKLRNILYDILIYNISLCDVILTVIEKFIVLHGNLSSHTKFSEYIYDFHKNFNNNYRPIFHLEKLLINIINEHCKLKKLKTQ